MSVEPCIVAVTAEEFRRLREQPHRFGEFIEDGYETGVFSYDWSVGRPLTRMLHLDEFGMWLLTGFDDASPLCRALVAFEASPLEGASYGHGGVRYHDPPGVKAVAAALESIPDAYLRERFDERAADYRLAAAGSAFGKNGDAGILAHQQELLSRVRIFYRNATDLGGFVLLMTV